MGEKMHDGEIAGDGLFHLRMKNFDGNRGSWNGGWRVSENDGCKGAAWCCAFAAGPEVGGRDKIMLQCCTVYLRNRSCADGDLVEHFEHFVEWPLEDALDDLFRVFEGVGFAMRMQRAELLA